MRLTAALCRAREAAGLTRVGVAGKLGRYAGLVSEVEARERRLDVIELDLFCRVYGVEFVAWHKSADLCDCRS